MAGNPERMRPTQASFAPHVIEANAIVFEAANAIVQEQMDKVSKKREPNLLMAATRFLKGITTS